jgi:hypothetical protein
MFILIIKLNDILKFDMVRHDLWLLYTFLDKDQCILDHAFTHKKGNSRFRMQEIHSICEFWCYYCCVF